MLASLGTLIGVATAGSVSLAWSANPEPDITGYRVFYGTTSDSLTGNVLDTESPAVTLSGLIPGETYYAAVMAINSYHLESSLSEQISFTIPIVTEPEISVELASGGVLASGQGAIDFGGVNLGAVGAIRNFVITNAGAGTLSGLIVTSDGGDFTVEYSGGTALAAGESAAFSVYFAPTATGLRSTSVRIASNDADENPFTIALSGSGVSAPEIGVERSEGTPVIHGQGIVHFSNSILGTTGTPEILTIRNGGNASLTNLAVTVAGSAAGDFVITQPGLATLAPGGSTTFQVAFKPTAGGTRGATLRIASNDADENPFEIALSGTGNAIPDIAVSHSGTPVSGPVGLGTVVLGASGPQATFTIANYGNATLSGLAISKSGAHPADFTVENLASTTIQPGGSASFKVTFRPAAAGTRGATLSIASNDPDENPFAIALTGEGLAVPEIAILRADSTEIADGASTVSFSEVTLGSTPAATTLTIRNQGTAPLTGLGISAVGSHAADFSVTALASPTLAPGTSTTFRISFNPTAVGPRVAWLQITSNDADESPFDIALTGTGAAIPTFPVLAVENSDGTVLAPESPATPFGEIVVGAGRIAKAFTIRNNGTASMTGLKLALTGAHATSFALAVPAVTVIEPGASMTFNVSFIPTAGGRRTAAVRITTSNSSLAAFDIGLDGSGLTVPEIAVTLDGNASLVAGGASMQFGRIDVGDESAARTVTIRNLGSATLKGLSLAGFGSFGSDFTTSRLASTSLAPRTSISFKVFFKPNAPGTRSGGVIISSNDADEGQFRITLGGTGVPVPRIEVVLDGGKKLTGKSAYIDLGSQGTESKGSSRIVTIKNTGTARLEGLAVRESGLHGSDFNVANLKDKALAPGDSTKIKVTFKPTRTGIRWGAIRIASNDADEKSIDIVLTGEGKSGSSSSGKSKPAKAKVDKNLAVIDGKKYLALTVTKKAGESLRPRDVEVSSNLIDWSSGSRHTTTLLNNAKTLKVRDNTPHTSESKRYIRLKP